MIIVLIMYGTAQPRVHAAGEHVVRPDGQAQEAYGQAGKGDHPVAEDRLAGEDREDLGDGAHRRQDHDVDRRVRVEPEQVLPQDRVAARRHAEEQSAHQAVERDQDQPGGQHRRGGQGQNRRGQHRPGEQRQSPEGHAEAS
jgi:hypothetical protein